MRRVCRWLSRRTSWVFVRRGRWLLGLECVPFRGIMLRTAGLGRDYRDPAEFSLSRPELSVKKIVLGDSTVNSQAKHLAPIDCRILGQLPSLVAHCCVTKYDDGSPRVPGWFTTGTKGAAWQVTVKDPDSGAKMVLTGNTLDDAFALAELMLGAEEAPWEVDPYLASQTKRKRKNG